MNKKRKFMGVFTAAVFTLGLIFNSIGVVSNNVSATTRASLEVNSIDDGAILHAWNWSFDTIKSRLPEIKAAGYKAVQTSPIQGSKEPLSEVSKWWVLYQPINFNIGNSQLGSRDQFKSMCDAAEDQGIDIIVDVVANHTGNRGGGADAYYPAYNVDPSIKDNPNFWHEHRGVSDWNNRWEVTQLGIGLADLNTSNHELQDKIIAFLNDAVDCGADGFRFDAAKHIELPDDSGCGSDFWPRVLGSVNNNENLFIYGEILQGGADRITAYHEYMKSTVDSYGGSVRSAVGYHSSYNANNAKNYPISSGPSNLVTWVESHDSYANDNRETTGLSDEEIKLAWAIIAGRAQSTPLFFNRPAGGYGVGNLGDAGNDLWKDPTVVAANKFRNAMAGQTEYVRTQGNDLFITDRAGAGTIVVNVSRNEVGLSSETLLAAGSYKDTVSGKTFNVVNRNGKNYFDGSTTISGRSVITLYAEDQVEETTEPEVKASVATNTKFVDSLTVKLFESNTNKATYSVNGGSKISYSNGKTIVLGSDMNVGDTVKLILEGSDKDGKTTKVNYVYEKAEKIENSVIRIKLPSGWSAPNAYIYDESVTPVKEVAKWPGVAMQEEGNGVYSYIIPDGYSEKTQVIFNSGSNQIPEAQQPGFVVGSGTSKIYEDGQWKEYLVKPEVSNPEVSSSIASGTTFKDSITVTLNEENTTKATYSIDGKKEVKFTNGTKIELGKNTQAGKSVKLTLVGTGEDGKTTTKVYTYTKKDDVIVTEGTTAKIKLPNGWNSANIYVYDESGSSVKTLADWPGVAMNNEGNNVYSYTLPEGWGENTRVIFNDGNNQIPAAQQPGLSLKPGECRIYENNSWNLVVTETIKPIKIESFTTNKLSPQIADTTITLSSEANGGSGELEYKFVVTNIDNETEKVIKNFDSSSVADWTPTVAGEYKVTVTVKDSKGNTESKTLESNYIIENRVSDIILEPLELSSKNGFIGEKVKVTANATGGIGTLNYRFYYKVDGKSTTIQESSSKASAEWTPTEAGTYSIRVKVTDSAGNTRTESKKYTVKESESDLNIESISADKEKITIGDKVTLSTVANGGTGELLYKFYYEENDEVIEIQDFSSNSTVEWTPEKVGSYTVNVKVKDEENNTLIKSIEIVVEDEAIENKVEITKVKLSDTTVKVGESVTIKTIATGSTNLQYRVAVHEFDNAWTTLHEFKSSNSTVWTPEVAGEYTIWIDVIDENGNYASKEIDFIVTK